MYRCRVASLYVLERMKGQVLKYVPPLYRCRVASLYVLERMKGQVISQVAARYQQLAVARAKWQGIHRWVAGRISGAGWLVGAVHDGDGTL
jgi:hypothetical protein